MSDPREVPPRCHQRLRRADFIARGDYVCVFYADHDGMHFGRMMREETGEIIPDGEVIRWGSPYDLEAEVALMVPSSKEDRSVQSDRFCPRCGYTTCPGALQVVGCTSRQRPE